MSSKYEKYNQFIFVCKDKDCKKAGAKELEKAFEREVKNRKLNKTTKVLESACMGRCKESPVAVVGSQWLGNIKTSMVEELMDKLHKPK